ncbi:NCS2 family permease [Paenibacillus profundus]|uniref:NCS2 family permease n=1 Tax=Paenibacillus profundus TaxID=1173085 RepID=A0ABS8YCQ0_9BACL|nr:NCS2 family permease [Paenibacillus profundus]MCE5168762.1 NCS2 family permease [Paenibacillus profundus]
MKSFFQFAERGTTYRKEIIAGLTTFLSMAYILVVNPIILSEAGMDRGAVFTATTLTAIIGTLLMGVLSNYPIGVASSMGLNSFFTYSVVIGMGISWQTALTGVFVSSILFIILSLIKVREKIIAIIPEDLKFAIASGIGFFVAFMGLKNAGIIVKSDATFVTLGDFRSGPTLLAAFGFIVTVILLVRNVRGAIFYGMIISTVVGMISGLVPLPTSILGTIPSLSPTFGAAFMHLDKMFTPELLAVVFTFLFVGFFDTAGTLIAIASQAGLMKDNQIPNAGRALLADSSASFVGSVLGTTTTASFIESSAGIAAGGRTGFTSVVISLLFALALFFSPLLSVVTTEVTAPALIVVGAMMSSQVRFVKWEKLEVAIPAFITIVAMPFTYGVATGIALGFILYTVIKMAKGEFREVHPIMYVLTVLFIAYIGYIA